MRTQLPQGRTYELQDERITRRVSVSFRSRGQGESLSRKRFWLHLVRSIDRLALERRFIAGRHGERV